MVALIGAAQQGPTFHISTKLALIIVAVLVTGAIGRYVETKDRHRRRAARKQRQREYGSYLRSDGWRERRQPALDRARGFCEDCGSRESLDVHHRTYGRKGSERPEDLVALCRRCHKARHKGDRTGVDWMLLAILRWWRVRSYARATRGASDSRSET